MSDGKSIGVNLRVTGHCNQGGRKYMEDLFSVAYQQTEDEKDLKYAFFGIFDGHGGRDAAIFAKEHLMEFITRQKNFWSDDDQLVLKAIKEGFLQTQQAMRKDLPNWRKTASGLPSTAGTTASIAFIKRGKLFLGHVGDSGIVLGEKDPLSSRWRARPLTRDHKPECPYESLRIKQSGGKVVNKSGVPRVVWYRPRGDHVGPVRRSTPIDEVPFLAVARALGDLWSYNAEDDVFIVSPEPDLHVYPISILKDRCLILATDGAWNVLLPDSAVDTVFDVEKNNEKHMINPEGGHNWTNPSKRLVDKALDRWEKCRLRADNISILTVMLDPPGPPRAQVLRKMYGMLSSEAPPRPPKHSHPSSTPIEKDDLNLIHENVDPHHEDDKLQCNTISSTSPPPPLPSRKSKSIKERRNSEDSENQLPTNQKRRLLPPHILHSSSSSSSSSSLPSSSKKRKRRSESALLSPISATTTTSTDISRSSKSKFSSSTSLRVLRSHFNIQSSTSTTKTTTPSSNAVKRKIIQSASASSSSTPSKLLKSSVSSVSSGRLTRRSVQWSDGVQLRSTPPRKSSARLLLLNKK